MQFPSVKKEEEKQANNFALKSTFYLTKKEILKLPEEFQKVFTIKLPIYVRRKPNGVYEARFRAHGYNICVSSVDYDELRVKFLIKLANYTPPKSAAQTAEELPEPLRPLFDETAKSWLELKRPTIKPTTYAYYVQLFGASILPAFSGRYLDEVKQSDVQAVLNAYIEQGKYRTATKLYQTLSAVFEFAVGEEILERSPMRKLRPPKYEERGGVALTLEEEREFLELLDGSKCDEEIKNALLLLLYTGIRRSELASARIEGEFVSVICAKVRKGYHERRRLIPITPMLAAWMHGIELDKLRTVRPDALTQAFKRLMPAHHLHELRHTFITRCQECGVSREVVSVWAGHAADNTQTSNVYTHFSREYMTKEAQKVIYNLVIPI